MKYLNDETLLLFATPIKNSGYATGHTTIPVMSVLPLNCE